MIVSFPTMYRADLDLSAVVTVVMFEVVPTAGLPDRA